MGPLCVQETVDLHKEGPFSPLNSTHSEVDTAAPRARVNLQDEETDREREGRAGTGGGGGGVPVEISF